ncbi:asparagine synthase-related protein [Spirosoma aerophilum]
MFFGSFSPHSTTNGTDLKRLQRAVEWNEGNFYEVNFHHFFGGFFLDNRLPYTPADCLYLDPANGLMVLVHGSVYNLDQLCSQYQLSPHNTTTPALIAALFLRQGPDIVREFNGDFAIVIFRAAENEFYIFRDHFGNVPLVYTQRDDVLFFSTDTLALCRVFGDENSFNVDPIMAAYKPVDLTLTPNRSVLMLKGGHWLQAQKETVSIHKYWEPERIQTDTTLTSEQLFSEMNTLLTDAIRIRSDRRFTAGSHLSGGLDSSLISVIARPYYSGQTPFYGYSWTPDNAPSVKEQTDERDLIRQICEMADITPSFIHVEPQDLIESTRNSLHNYMYFHEEKVLKLANLHQTNLVFSGWGGDEFFSLTSMGIDADLVFNGNWKAFFAKNPVSNPKKIIKYLIYKVLLPAAGYILPSTIKSYYDTMYFYKKEHRQFHKKYIAPFTVYGSRRGFHLNMIYTHHIAERTGPWCIMGYKNGVVYRYPLLDVRLVEYMLKVPSQLLIDGQHTRILPRKLSAGWLPESVRWLPAKNDPARFALINQQEVERGLLFMDEVSDFKTNPDLSFIDFELLEREIGQYRSGNKHHASLFGELVTIKFYHEFTKNYRKDV